MFRYGVSGQLFPSSAHQGQDGVVIGRVISAGLHIWIHPGALAVSHRELLSLYI
jgi:hypothetical protein